MMSQENSPGKSPYKGLQPYGERDRDFFFGREKDREVIISNLFAAPLTVFYGASGVGKSSVLLAGVVPELRKTKRVAVVVFREWQDPGFESALKREVLKSINFEGEMEPDLKLELDEFLFVCAKQFRGSLFFILDQFEEYFFYHPVSTHTERFDAAFARTINRTDIKANFLLSLRDDGLGRLDRFQKRIPNLLNNMLRLEHLGRRSAELAIREPLKKYNDQVKENEPRASIEDELVNVLLEDLQTGKVTLALTGQGKIGSKIREDHTPRIETPFLQVVLTRLWEEEYQVATEKHADLKLRLETYKSLGGATQIVRTHLDKIMETDRLLPYQDTTAALFHFLVTPTGMKIAHTVGDLASYSKRPEGEVSKALNALSAPDVRILRPIAPPLDQTAGKVRYEIFHDVLAPAILDWRLRYQKIADQQELEHQRARAEKEARSARRFRRLSYALGAVCLVALIAIGFAALYYVRSTQLQAEGQRLREEGSKLKALGESLAVMANAAQRTADANAAAAKSAQDTADKAQADADDAQKRVDLAEKRSDERARQIDLANVELRKAQAEVENEQLYRDAFRLSRNYSQRTEAIEKFNVVLNHYRYSKNNKSLMLALFDTGRVHLETGELQQAKSLLDEALSRASGPADQAATLGKIGDLYRDLPMGSPQTIRRSEESYQQAFEIYERLGDATGQTMMLLGRAQGMANRAFGQSPVQRPGAVDEAMKQFAVAADFARNRNLPDIEGLVWMTAADARVRIYDSQTYPAVLDLFQKARSAYASASNAKGEINALTRIIEINQLIQDHNAIAKARADLLQLCVKTSDLLCHARTLSDLLRERPSSEPRNSPEAINLANQARQLFLILLERKTNTAADLQQIGDGLYSVALVYGVSQKSIAFETAEKSAMAYRLSKIENIRFSNVLTYLVSLAIEMGRAMEAQNYLKEAIEVTERLNHPQDKIYSLLEIGLRYDDLKNDAMAAKYFDAALSESREFDKVKIFGDWETEIDTVRRIGEHFIFLKQEDKARRYFEQALNRQRPPKKQLEALRRIAEIYASNISISPALLDIALTYYERALAVADSIGRFDKALIYRSMAQVYLKRGKDGDAQKAADCENLANDLMKSLPTAPPSPTPTP